MASIPEKTHDGWFSKADILMYNEIIKQHIPKGGVFVEVGTWMGMSAKSISKACIRKKITLYCVDHWRGSNEHREENLVPDDLFFQFLHSVRDRGFLGRPIVPIIMESIQASEFFLKANQLVDGVFIDAGHDEESVQSDIAAWRRVIKHGGWIAGHDYNHEGGWKEVAKTVDRIFPHAVKRKHGSDIWLADPHR